MRQTFDYRCVVWFALNFRSAHKDWKSSRGITPWKCLGIFIFAGGKGWFEPVTVETGEYSSWDTKCEAVICNIYSTEGSIIFYVVIIYRTLNCKFKMILRLLRDQLLYPTNLKETTHVFLLSIKRRNI